MKRKDALAYVRIAGYHDDRPAFTRLLIENRISRAAADEAWTSGKQVRRNGVGCTCHQCSRTTT